MKNKNLKQLKTALSRRRGIAIEMAMLFMLAVVALSILLVSVSMMQIGKLDRADGKLEERMVLDQIGEDFCRYRGSYSIPVELDDEYCLTEHTETLLKVGRVPEGEGETPVPVLTVELRDNNDGTYTVTKWSYGE